MSKAKEQVFAIYIESHDYERFLIRATFAGLTDILEYESRWITAYKYIQDPEPKTEVLLITKWVKYVKHLGELKQDG